MEDHVRKKLLEAMQRRLTVTDFEVYTPASSGWYGLPNPNTTNTASRPSHMSSPYRSAVKQHIVTAPEQSFDDIIGNEDALAMLKDAITAPVENAELYEVYGMTVPKGAVLHGPPGCGKTMFARAAATEMRRLYGSDVEYLVMSGPELQSTYIGQTEQKIKAIFSYAHDYKESTGHPLLIFIDEAETILPDRNGTMRHVHSYEESQVAAFLAEMDGVVESSAFVMLATNRIEAIDQALLRDGRCDFKIEVKRPDMGTAEEILRRGFSDASLLAEPIADLIFAAVECFADPSRVLMAGTHDGKAVHFTLKDIVSGAMVASVVKRATRRAFTRDKKSGVITGITTGDVVGAVDDIFTENKNIPHTYALRDFVKNEVMGK
jgi:SpoVK/Ycf46/Vps4 family AAA+-type ATPase